MGIHCQITMTRFNEDYFTTKATSIFENLLSSHEHSDVTLFSNDEQSLKAHKFILGASSPFFERIFVDNIKSNLCIFLQGVGFAELQMIIKFLYTGETEVAEDKLNSLLDTAQYLEIKGLIEYLPKCGPGQELMGLPATSEDPNSEKELMSVLDDAQAQETNQNTNEKEIIQKLSDKVRNFPCDKCD